MKYVLDSSVALKWAPPEADNRLLTVFPNLTISLSSLP